MMKMDDFVETTLEKLHFVLGIQGRDSLVLGRVSECLCGYFILWEGARFIWGQSKTGVLHLAS